MTHALGIADPLESRYTMLVMSGGSPTAKGKPVVRRGRKARASQGEVAGCRRESELWVEAKDTVKKGALRRP